MKAVLKIFYLNDSNTLSSEFIGTPVLITSENLDILKNNIQYIKNHIAFVEELNYSSNTLDILEKYQNEFWFYKEYAFYKTEGTLKFKISEKEYENELLKGNVNIFKNIDKNYAKWYIKLKNINNTYDVVSSIWIFNSEYEYDIVIIDENNNLN